MAESIEDLLFRVRVDPSQLDQLAPEVAEELLKAARAASNFQIDESVFVRAGQEMGQSVLRGLQQFLSGKGIDVSQLFTGDLSKAVDKSGVERLQRELTQAASRATGRAQSDPSLAQQSAELQSLINRREALSRASVPRAPLENVGGQPVLRKGANLARELGLNPADFVRALGLTPGQSLPQASTRQSLGNARDAEVARLTRQIESLSGSVSRAAGFSPSSGGDTSGAVAFERNLNRLAPAFEAAGRAKDGFITNLEKLQRVFDAVSTAASNAATASQRSASSSSSGNANAPRQESDADRIARSASSEGGRDKDGVPLHTLSEKEFAAEKDETAAGRTVRGISSRRGEDTILSSVTDQDGARARRDIGLVEGITRATTEKALYNARTQVFGAGRGEDGRPIIADQNLSGQTVAEVQRLREQQAKFNGLEGVQGPYATPAEEQAVRAARAAIQAQNTPTQDIKAQIKETTDRAYAQGFYSSRVDTPTAGSSLDEQRAFNRGQAARFNPDPVLGPQRPPVTKGTTEYQDVQASIKKLEDAAYLAGRASKPLDTAPAGISTREARAFARGQREVQTGVTDVSPVQGPQRPPQVRELTAAEQLRKELRDREDAARLAVSRGVEGPFRTPGEQTAADRLRAALSGAQGSLTGEQEVTRLIKERAASARQFVEEGRSGPLQFPFEQTAADRLRTQVNGPQGNPTPPVPPTPQEAERTARRTRQQEAAFQASQGFIGPFRTQGEQDAATRVRTQENGDQRNRTAQEDLTAEMRRLRENAKYLGYNAAPGTRPDPNAPAYQQEAFEAAQRARYGRNVYPPEAKPQSASARGRSAGLGSGPFSEDDVQYINGAYGGYRQSLLAQMRASTDPLEREIELEGEIAREENRRRALRERLARFNESEARKGNATPLSDAAQRFIDEDPNARRNAATYASRQERFQNRQNAQESLREYLENDDATTAQKFGAVIRGRVPGAQPGPQPSVGERFRGGFLGDRLDPVEQIGQTLRFSTFYGGAYTALSGLEQAFTTAVQGALQYEDALKNLEISTTNTNEANRQLADTLSGIGTATGFGSAVGVQTGVANIGLYDLSQAGVQQQTAVAGGATEVALRLARLSNADPVTVSTQLAGTIRGFGLSDQSQSQVEDALAVISKRSGVSSADLLSATTQVGTAASGAGFDLEDTLAAISQIRSGTGDTPTAVAGYLAQIFSRASDPALEKRLGAVGVNTQDTTLKQQLDQLTELNLPKEQIQQIAQSFSRGRAGQALNIYLSQRGAIDNLAGEARNADPGEGRSIFQELTNFNIGEQFKRLGSDFGDLVNEITKTGLVDFLFLLVEAARGAVTLLTNVVSTFNQLPDAIQKPIVYLGELYLALRLLSAARGAAIVISTLGSNITRTASLVAASPLASAARTALTGGAATVAGQVGTRAAIGAGASAGSTAAGAAGAGLLARLGLGNLLGTGLGAAIRTAIGGFFRSAVTRVAGVVGAAGGIISAGNNTDQTQYQLNEANRASGAASTVEELRAAAAQQRAVVNRTLDTQTFFKFGSLSTLGLEPLISKLGFSPAARQQAQARAAGDSLNAQADALDAASKASVENNPALAFGQFTTVDSVSTAFESLTTKGYSARQSLDALNDAFDAMSSAATGARTGVAAVYLNEGSGGDFAQRLGGAAGTSINDQVARLRTDADLLQPGGAADNGIISRFFGQGGQFTAGLYGTVLGIGGRRNGLSNIAEGLNIPGLSNARDMRGLATELEGKSSGANKAVTDAVTRAYAKLGVDPSKGDVALTSDELGTINTDAEAALKSSLGDTYDKLGKEGQKALLDAYVKAARSAAGDFSGQTISGTNVEAFVATSIAGATTLGSETSGLTRNARKGSEAQLGALQDARQRVVGDLANAGTENDRLKFSQQISQLDIAINSTKETLIGQRQAEVADLVAVYQSARGLDDTVGRQDDTITGIQRNLADPDLTPEQKRTLNAQLSEANKQQAANRRGVVKAQLTAVTNPRNKFDELTNQLSNVNLDIDAATPGSENQANLIRQRAEILSQQTDYSLSLSQASRAVQRKPGDQTTALRDAVTDATEALAQAKRDGDPLAIGQAQTQLDEANYAVSQYSIQTAASLRASKRRPGNTQEQLRDAVTDATAVYNDAVATGDPKAIADALSALNQANYAVVQYSLQVTAAQRSAIQPRNQAKQLSDAIQNASDTLADARATGDPKAIADAQAGLDKANAAADDYGREARSSSRAAGRNPLDTRGALVDAISAAQDRVNQVTAITGQYDQKTIDDALAALSQSTSQLAQYDSQVQNTYGLAKFAPDDRLGRAGETMRQAQTAYQKYLSAGLQDTQEAAQAFSDMKQAEFDYAQAVLNVVELTNIALAGDSTDPVRQAQIRYEQLLAKQRAASTPEEKAALQPDIDSANSDLTLAPIDKKLRDIGNDHDLKKITDSEYINALQTQLDAVNAQLALMDPLAEGYDALAQKSVEIQKLIQGAAESLNSEFNLNDVQLPTVYEVRRAVGASADQIRSQVVDYSSTNSQVIINGADMTQVIAYINQVLGTGSSAVYTTSPRRTV